MKSKDQQEIYVAAKSAIKAALAYDAAIQRRAVEGRVDFSIPSIGIATGDDLDDLYDDWITKAKIVDRLMEN